MTTAMAMNLPEPMDSIGSYLKSLRLARAMSLAEVSRTTRIPVPSLEIIESDQFERLPGEVFTRGFLRAYARTLGVAEDELLDRYASAKRLSWVTPLPLAAHAPLDRNSRKRMATVAALLFLLLMFALALSIVLSPRKQAGPALSWLGTTHHYVS